VGRRRRTATTKRAPIASTQGAAGGAVAPAEQNADGRLQGDRTGEPEALTVTHWFDSGDDGQTYAATVRFSGQRVGVRGKPTARDAFIKNEVIQGIVPGSGPVSITTHVYGLAAGEWTVTADLIRGPRAADRPRATASGRSARGHTLPRAAWSWRRWALSSGPFQPVQTRWAPLTRLVSPPAVIPGSWFGLVLLGALVGLGIQSTLLARD